MYRLPFRYLREKAGLSERELASAAGVSRLTLRNAEAAGGNPTLRSLALLARPLGRRIVCLAVPTEEAPSDYSTVAVSQRVQQEGFSSWKIHYMELVDEFCKRIDPRLILLPPIRELHPQLRALLASIVLQLCEEVGQESPGWARQRYFLDDPWFISGMESLKAMAIRESPLAFRRNNIFVHENFLQRA